METIVITYEYSRNEFVKATQQYLLANGTIRKYDPAIVVVFLLFSVCFRFFFDLTTLGVILFVITLLFSAFAGLLYFYMPVLLYKRNPKYHEAYTLAFSKDSINFKTPSIDSVIQWSAYAELWESEDFYFLIQAPRAYSVIPKRTFKDAADQQVFEEMAALNIKKSKRV